MSELTLASGFSVSLIFSTLFFWGAGVLILNRFFGFPVSVILVSLKLFLPFSFFAFWGDGSWFIGADDQSYFNAGVKLVESGENPITIWFSAVGKYVLTEHPILAIYHWWNMVWMYFFGTSYFVVVLANVFTTLIAGVMLCKVADTLKFEKMYGLGLAVFFIFHWEVLSWSSFLNIKEPLIVTLMIANIWAFLKIERGHLFFLVLYLGSLLLLLGIRFYIPALLGAATAGYLILYAKKRFFIFPIVALGIGVILWKYWYTLGLVERLAVFEIKSFTWHLVKAIWSPLPWRVTDPALYLVPTSVMNTVTVPLSLLGFISMAFYGHSKVAIYILLAVVSGYVFYSLIPPLSSVRHIFPFNALLIIFQFHLLWSIFIGIRTKAINQGLLKD